MYQTKDELILSYGAFFHYTDPGNMEAILQEGLQPQQTDTLTPKSRKLICVAPAGQINKWKDQMSSKNPALIRIAAEDIISKEYGIDHTFDGWETASEMGEVEGLRYMIEHHSTLAVFEPIPPDQLTEVPHV